MTKDYSYLLEDLERAENRSQEKINPDQKLSLCMIVKDEEKFLEDALKSVQGIVDEIIIVDTGSEDKTVEIARKYGAQVFFKAWNNDFAEARNESIKHATGQWILIMDADERIPEGFGQNLRSLLIPTEEPVSYLTHIKNYMHENDESSILGHYVVRVFRKTADSQFFGAIHEQLYPNWGHVTIPEESFHLIHLGYGDLKKKDKKIRQRNVPMIKAALEETRGKNPSLYSFYAYYMGASVSQPEEIMYWMNESIDNCSDPENTPHIEIAYLDILKAYFYAGKYSEGLAAGEKGLASVENLKTYPDFLELMAVLLTANGDHEKALTHYSKVLDLVEENSDDALFFTAKSSRIGSWGTLLNMCVTAALMKNSELARDYAEKALSVYPDQDKSPLVDRIDHILGSPDVTHAFFENAESTEENAAFNMKILSNNFLKKEMPFEAVMLQSKLHDAEQVTQTAVFLASQYLQHKRFDLALKTFKGILSIDKNNLSAKIGQLFLENEQEDLSSQLNPLFEQAESMFEYRVFGELALHFGYGEQARKAFEKMTVFPAFHYDAELRLAMIEQETEKVDAAMHRLHALIKDFTEKPDAYVQLGNLFLMYGQFEHAEPLFAEALSLERNNWYYYYGLALCLAGQERFQDAEKAILYASKLSRNNGNLINLYQMIQQEKTKEQVPN